MDVAQNDKLTAVIREINVRTEPDAEEQPGWGCFAVAKVDFLKANGGSITGMEIRTPGLWGIDVEPDGDYLTEVGDDELAELGRMLAALGLDSAEKPTYRTHGGAPSRELVYWFSSYEGRQDPVSGPERLPRGEALDYLAYRLRDLAGGSTVPPPRGWSEWSTYASDRLTRAAKTPGRFLRVPALDAGEGRPDVGCWVWVGYPDS